MKLKNTSAGDRGVYIGGDLVMVAPGGTVEDVDALEAESVKEWFAIEDAEAAPADPYADTSDDDLRAMVEERTGKKPHHKTGRAKLIEALA